MVKAKPLLTSFTPEGDHLAVLSPKGTLSVWKTSNGSLLAEWKLSDDMSAVGYLCMAISFVGKKRKKEYGSCILALGTNDGSIFAIDAFTGETKWKSTECHPGGLAGFSFVKKGRYLCVVGSSGVVYEISSETGEQTKNLKVSKKPISSLAFSLDARFICMAAGKLRILELENGKEVAKFPNDLGHIQYASISNDGKTVITSEVGEKHLQIWNCDLSSKIATKGPILAVPHALSAFECKNVSNGNPMALAVSDSGTAYVWNLNTISENVNATKITVKPKKAIVAAKLHSVEAEERVTALVAYGSVDSPKFSLVEISKPGENIVVNAKVGAGVVQENGVSAIEGSELAATPVKDNKANRKRAAPDPDLPNTRGADDAGLDENRDGVLVEDDPNEPTMGEKLASLQLSETDQGSNPETEGAPPNIMPPSADSVNVLLKQALQADDRALLLDCLYNRDEKVITNSVAKLNSSDVVKLLRSLVPIIQSRGAVLACALPWIKSLLLQHAGGIMSQESSLLALNSVYQLIESRVSTFQTAIEVSSCLDFLYSGIVDNVDEEDDTAPVIYEDEDESDEEESEDAMETDDKEGEVSDEAVDGIGDFEGNNDMSE